MSERPQGGDGALGIIKEAVEIDGNQLRRLERAQVLGVTHPAAREVPPALGRRPGIAIEGGAERLRHRLADLDVGPERFGPRLLRVVPVAIQHHPLGHTHRAAVDLPRLQAFRAVHPEGVLSLERIEVGQGMRRIGGAGVQPDHRGEIRRLAAREIVAAVAVGDVTDGRDEMREVVEHVLHEVGAPAARQPLHREVAVPVIDLAETAAGNDVRLRQRDQGRARVHAVGRSREHRPQPVDVVDHALRRHTVVSVSRRRRGGQHEVLIDERPQHETARAPSRIVARRDRGGSRAGSRVHEFFRVRKNAGELDVGEQRSEIVGGVV